MNEEIKKRVADLIEMDRRSCQMDVFSPEYVSRMLHISIEDATEALKELGEMRV